MIRAVLCDFDGTLFDTFSILLAAGNKTLAEFGKPPVKDPKALREMSPAKVIRTLGVSIWQLPKLRATGLAYARDALQRARPFQGIPEALSEIRKHCLLAVVSSNDADTIRSCLDKHKIGVEAVYAGKSIFGKHHLLKRALRDLRVKPEEAVYIGDELRDAQACAKVGLRFIAVGWGYNSAKSLKAANPYKLVKTPAELMKTVLE